MRTRIFKSLLAKAGLLVSTLLLSCGPSFADQVNLTAGPATATLPDGSTVPMWGYSCGAAVSGSNATCTALNPAVQALNTSPPAGYTVGSAWSPVVITVPTGTDLTISLTNGLSFTNGNSVPTSLVIVGQLGGGLGNVTQRTTTASPSHANAQPLTWPIAGTAPGVAPVGVGTPPPQGPRVQSFATEVAAGATSSLTWTAPRPGTYLIESGTHPSIQGPMGLYGIVVVTSAPTATGTAPATTETAAGCAYPGATTGTCTVPYDAEFPLLFSEIDPVQNAAVSTAVNTAGFSETMVWSGQPGGCGNPASATYHQCYPPAVNYTPLYYMINGVAFDKTHASASLFASSPGTLAPATGPGAVLVRMVNAGLRMHVPSIVGAQTGATSAPGFSLIAEDGNLLPGVPRVQSEVFMAAGKTYDVMVNAPAAGSAALPVYDRELSLSGNATERDAGMLAYLGVNGAGLPAATSTFAAAHANADSYLLVPGNTLTVADVAKGVIANDVGVSGVRVLSGPANGSLTLDANGTFVYGPTTAGWAGDTFTYCANTPASATTCPANLTATVTLGVCSGGCLGTAPVASNVTFMSNVATRYASGPPGVLGAVVNTSGLELTALFASGVPPAGLTLNADGSFIATGPGTACSALNPAPPAGSTCFTFGYQAKTSTGLTSNTAQATVVFPPASGLVVTVLDGKDKTTPITDYRWIIEEDRTFYIDPTKTTNTGGTTATTVVPTFGTNFHTSHMPVVATGCTGPISCEGGTSTATPGQTMYDSNPSSPTYGQHIPAVCDVGDGVCRPDPTAQGMTPVLPSTVHLDPTKRYYLSVLPGDAANPFISVNLSADCTNGSANATNPGACGHGMGGAPIAAGQTAVTVVTQPSPYPPAKLSVFVFEDDFPLNGEQDAGGGVDVLATNEPGLGGFNITLFDDAGGTGDPTGQITYDMFNQPLSNSLAGTIDPATGQDACPIAQKATTTPAQKGITGVIVTCPKFEADGKTLSPLAGQAVIANMMPGRYGVVATPAAERIAKGEEWLQTNTLDGQKAHDSFLRIAEPSYFQEYGPAGYHVSIGFANPAIINARLAGVCKGADPNLTGTNCTHTVKGMVTTERMSRTPDERLYSSGDNTSFAFTQCYVSIGDPDGEDFAFTKCKADGTFSISGLPDGDWRVTVFDQWNDMLVDGLSTPVGLGTTPNSTTDMGQIAMNQWQANIYTTTFFDANGNGVRDSNEAGLTLVPTNIRFRDGSFSNFNNTDLNGYAGFNEVFPLFSWYVIETDSTRYKNTGTHVVYDAGGPADGTPCGTNGIAPCGNSTIGHFMANTAEQVSLPTNLRVPGAFYCANADCTDASAPFVAGGSGGSTGRVDPPWVTSEGWQGFSGQNSFIEFGKQPFGAGENGGIRGHVVYASTRPFDDPSLLLQTSWEPLVPGVTINLYQEALAADGITKTLKLVDTTKTSSWDDWAQGFYPGTNKPYMNCPGQLPAPTTSAAGDLFFYTLYNQPMWLDEYNNGGTPAHIMPNNSQFKCYDGMHNWNQVQPAPYDGMYQFPSIAGRDSNTGAPVGGTGSVAGSNCAICVANPTDGTPMLPPGKYVVEVVVPPGYELVKEEDKNILIGDNYIAPVTVQFPGLGGSIFIMPDQATINASYNANNAQNPTSNLGSVTFPRHEGDTGSIETFWPCVGQARIVPDYISLFPGSHEVAPFAGATRNLCDRKEVTLEDQSSALAKFYIFTSTHAAAHFTGVITDDFTSEFDPFSPQFGEKFSPPNLPISIKDWTGTEISRVYSDQWGTYNGLTYSTWEVNPPNPTGYAPTMMVTCMNDPGNGPAPDPLFNPAYSQFCYEIPFMPGQTQYMDTPVVPTSAFAGAGYNNADCAYPDAMPAIKEVDGDGVGPWVSATGHNITITALGDQAVNNYGYSGPSSATSPFNQKKVTRHYGFGTRCTAPTAGSATCNTQSTVTIGVNPAGVPIRATIVSWSDTQIVATVPTLPQCAMQQQAQYGGSTAYCGQLVITAGNGKQSVDAVTVTAGGKTPTHVAASSSIQSALDAAAPGDLIMVDPTCTSPSGAVPCTTAGATYSPSAHNELLIMWKPVRLQGVGAASSIINANAHPAGKLDPWRASVNCLFGLALNGQPSSAGNAFDSTGQYTCPNPGSPTASGSGPDGHTWNYFYGGPNWPALVVDRIPLEGILGWDATVNGNLAEQLQEPSLMGAYEGAGITVLAKGVNIPAGATDVFGSGAEAAFPAGTTLLTGTVSAAGTSLVGDANPLCHTSSTNSANPYPSNFQCNPSSIDGLGITNASQGGGGINVHAWAHNLQIANNRVYNNAGTLSGGMSIGQGESPEAYLNGSSAGVDFPGSCLTGAGLPTTTQLPYCINLKVNIHHNYVTNNASTGDELFSGTPAGAGGVSICTGADYYKFNYNWICGNLSTGDGGGVGHLGFSWNGDIEHNSFLFNQSTNPTIQSHGGGLIVMGAAPDATITVNGVATECGSVTDNDCVPGLSDGIGPGLVINANLFQGNAAESGSGGGIRLQAVNGTDVPRFPGAPQNWYSVMVTNNIIDNNVAGWDGAGVSLEDALAVTLMNNTIASNDTTASSGVLFNTLGAPLSSSQSPPPTCLSQNGGTASCPQPAGLVTMQNSPQLVSSFAATATTPALTITCPPGNYSTASGGTATNGTCTKVSYPALYNNIFWQNRAFDIGVGALGSGTLNQQNVVSLYNAFSGTPAGSQTSTGACPSGASYWDIGVRNDTGPANHTSGVTLNPLHSVLTSTTGYSPSNQSSNPLVTSQYCNGSRVPPEATCTSPQGLPVPCGFQVPPGIADATVPNPIFSLMPTATVDEGNNWINISWGPLSTSSPVTGALLGNYSLQGTSPALNAVPCNTGSSVANGCIETISASGVTTITAPKTDFFGNPRPDPGPARSTDIGAVELPGH